MSLIPSGKLYYFKKHPWVDLLKIIVRSTPYKLSHKWESVCKDSRCIVRDFDLKDLSYPDLCFYIQKIPVENKFCSDIPTPYDTNYRKLVALNRLDIQLFINMITTQLAEEYYVETLDTLYHIYLSDIELDNILKILKSIDHRAIKSDKPWYNIFRIEDHQFTSQVITLESERNLTLDISKIYLQGDVNHSTLQFFIKFVDWNIFPQAIEISNPRDYLIFLMEIGSPPEHIIDIISLLNIQYENITKEYNIKEHNFQHFKEYIITQDDPFVEFFVRNASIANNIDFFQYGDDVEKYLSIFIQHNFVDRMTFYFFHALEEDNYSIDMIQFIIQHDPHVFNRMIKLFKKKRETVTSESKLRHTIRKHCWSIWDVLHGNIKQSKIFERVMKNLIKYQYINMDMFYIHTDESKFVEKFLPIAPFILPFVQLAIYSTDARFEILKLIIDHDIELIRYIQPDTMKEFVCKFGFSVSDFQLEKLIDYFHHHFPSTYRVQSFIRMLIIHILERRSYTDILILLHRVFEQYEILLTYDIVEFTICTIKHNNNRPMDFRTLDEKQMLNEIFGVKSELFYSLFQKGKHHLLLL